MSKYDNYGREHENAALSQYYSSTEKVKIIYNDDSAILDYLCELKDRRVIRNLQHFIDDVNERKGLLMINSDKDQRVILFLTRNPFGFNEGSNKLIMYAHTNLRGLIMYFKNLLDHTPESTGESFTALDDIVRYLYFTWTSEAEENTSLDCVG